MIPVLMAGELKEWSAEAPIGEIHNFDWELFKNSSDTNIQLMGKVVELIDETFHSFKNINSIELEEEEEEI